MYCGGISDLTQVHLEEKLSTDFLPPNLRESKFEKVKIMQIPLVLQNAVAYISHEPISSFDFYWKAPGNSTIVRI